MRRLWACLLVLPSLTTLAPAIARAGQSRVGDCGNKVPAGAQRVFDDLVSAFRSANAKGVVGLIDKGDDARLVLQLRDVPRKAYPSAQVLGILESYFKRNTVTALTETKDCPKGEGAAFARSFLLTTRADSTEVSEHLTVRVHRVDVDKKPSYSILESLEATLIPRK